MKRAFALSTATKLPSMNLEQIRESRKEASLGYVAGKAPGGCTVIATTPFSPQFTRLSFSTLCPRRGEQQHSRAGKHFRRARFEALLHARARERTCASANTPAPKNTRKRISQGERKITNSTPDGFSASPQSILRTIVIVGERILEISIISAFRLQSPRFRCTIARRGYVHARTDRYTHTHTHIGIHTPRRRE